MQPVGLVDPHRLDDVAVGQRVGQVAQLAVDPGHDDRPVGPEQVGRGSPLSDRSLAPATDTVMLADTAGSLR
jgi:hypothetical protein